MSAYPGTGGSRVLVKQELRKQKSLFYQVEEIILVEPDVPALAEYLRSLASSSVTVFIDIFERYYASPNLNECPGLESTVTCTIDAEHYPKIQTSQIAQMILSRFRKDIAGSTPWIFSPLLDLYLFNLNEDKNTESDKIVLHRDKTIDVVIHTDSDEILVEKHSPYNRLCDGEAIVKTTVGEIYVFHEQGYLLQGWNSLNLEF